MLEVKGLNVFYGGIHALKGASLKVEKGKIATLIGSNGAGKSTTLRTITGLVTPKNGEIKFLGSSIVGKPVHEIVKAGIAMVPEGRRVFSNLTVYENLLIGGYNRNDEKGIKDDLEWIFFIFPRLSERAKQLAGTLSGGEQQMLALGRALMSRPKLLMMDEPSLGLAPQLVVEVFEIIKKIHQEGTTILLVEQNAVAALEVADYAYVLETGKITLEGKGEDLLKDERVKKAYLGIK
ncbi:MAG: ABC transporter ATP-binding protein [Spirochaetes bacterium]|nr:ABC transporter ATP-binding protein [Deltaproteobacteria bacterium]RKY00820.1 MAG: ABC transporter ATP-binding protein [Spirochaetota bacterium]RLA90440.1 MAG: ABC transporter ATP-binding protein [Deltaproteobacteria bacterium]